MRHADTEGLYTYIFDEKLSDVLHLLVCDLEMLAGMHIQDSTFCFAFGVAGSLIEDIMIIVFVGTWRVFIVKWSVTSVGGARCVTVLEASLATALVLREAR